MISKLISIIAEPRTLLHTGYRSVELVESGDDKPWVPADSHVCQLPDARSDAPGQPHRYLVQEVSEGSATSESPSATIGR